MMNPIIDENTEIVTNRTPTLSICHSARHPTKPIIAWACNNALFALNYKLNQWLARRLTIHDQPIRALDYNSTSSFWMTASEDKKVVLFKDCNFEPIYQCQVDTKITCALFLNEKKLLIGDKFGRIFLLPLSEFKKFSFGNNYTEQMKNNPHDEIFSSSYAQNTITKLEESITINGETNNNYPILGHLSIIIGMALSSDTKWLISADRDGKVRLSRGIPDFQTENFCFGNQEFISSVLVPPAPFNRLVVTTSGDSTIRLFQINTGKQLDLITLKNYEASQSNFTKVVTIPPEPIDSKDPVRLVPSKLVWSINSTLLVLIENYKTFLEIPLLSECDPTNQIFSFGQSQLHHLPSIPLSLIPVPIVDEIDISKPTIGVNIFWINSKGELMKPVSILDSKQSKAPLLPDDREWVGTDIRDNISPAKVYYWKTIKEFSSDSYYSRRSIRKSKKLI